MAFYDAYPNVYPKLPHPSFAVGQKVRNQDGETLTVLQQFGLRVMVREQPGAVYNPFTLSPVGKRG